MHKFKLILSTSLLMGTLMCLTGCVVAPAPTGPIPGRQCWKTVGPQGYVHWHCNGYRERRCWVNNYGREVCNYA